MLHAASRRTIGNFQMYLSDREMCVLQYCAAAHSDAVWAQAISEAVSMSGFNFLLVSSPSIVKHMIILTEMLLVYTRYLQY